MALTASPDWDYTLLASSYDKRPDYSPKIVQFLLDLAWRPSALACDIGAGTARLTVAMAQRGFRVVALEPNLAMLRQGLAKTRGLADVDWVRGLGEAVGLRGAVFDLVVFGSTWNVVEQPEGTREAARLLRPGGRLACLFNHRDLSDPLQQKIEDWIREKIPAYDYGVRRSDLSPRISWSGLFDRVETHEARFVAEMSRSDCLQAWRAHATLRRQAGDSFPQVLEGIRKILWVTSQATVKVPYTTRLWTARRCESKRDGVRLEANIPVAEPPG